LQGSIARIHFCIDEVEYENKVNVGANKVGLEYDWALGKIVHYQKPQTSKGDEDPTTSDP